MLKKVICAMSGGVDSSVAAALLKRANFNVAGVFMKLWSAPRRRSSKAERRARAVAEILGIPLYTFDFSREFQKRIVDRFLQEYRAGRTPNPCVICNKEIKFGLLLEKALVLGAQGVATGHYARLQRGKLLRGKDKEKDQSYFLWMLKQGQLKRLLFPLGNYTKKEVRALARKFGLPVLDAPESMEICFIQTTINDFLRRYLKQKPGKIVDATGKIVGQHQGLAFYTIGQRKGIGLPGGPYFVTGKNFKKNLLVVTKNEKDLLKREVIFRDVNWLAGRAPKMPARVRAKIRYRQPLAPGVLKRGHRFVFNRPQRAVTPGQSVVFYKNEELLGGGIIG